MPLLVYIRLYYVAISSVFILIAYYMDGQAIEDAVSIKIWCTIQGVTIF